MRLRPSPGRKIRMEGWDWNWNLRWIWKEAGKIYERSEKKNWWKSEVGSVEYLKNLWKCIYIIDIFTVDLFDVRTCTLTKLCSISINYMVFVIHFGVLTLLANGVIIYFLFIYSTMWLMRFKSFEKATVVSRYIIKSLNAKIRLNNFRSLLNWK